ncbi:hypothetical protein M513_08012 [Trichuris suis]|uniref:SSD domain-containing protein n=1 Tax=Trichuris suis TaxID=68888 RepID=A0A085M1L6_9BILA|nr:hypothetical protein M513_08012 [Trichuris suis]
MDGLLRSAFEQYGLFVAHHAVAFVLYPIATTLLLSAGLSNFSQQLDLDKLYTPHGSPFEAESEAVERFWNSGDNNAKQSYLVQVLFENNGANVLRMRTLRHALNVHNFIVEQLNYTADGGELRNFWKRLCLPQQQCRYANTALLLLLKGLLQQSSSATNPNIRFRYPFMESLDLRLFIGYNIMDVDDKAGEAKIITLNYPIVTNSTTMMKEVDAFDDALRNYLSKECNKDKGLPCIHFSRSFLMQQAMKSALALVPAIGFLLLFMLGFTICSNISISKPAMDKRWEGAAGCLSSVMAIFSSVGLLLYFEIPLNGTIVAVPFLAMAIGIDDTFLTIQAWKLTNPMLPPERRLSLALRDSGVAITLTSMTDIALFSIGLLSEMPAIQVFSLYTAAAMAFDYVYQMTFFSAIVYLLGRKEDKKTSLFWQCRPIQKVKPREGNIMQMKRNRKSFNLTVRTIFDAYIPLLRKPIVKLSIGIAYILYLAVAFWGCSQIRVNFTASKLVLASSPARRFSELMDHYYLKTAELHVFIQKPPDFRNDTQLMRFLEFVRILESTPYSGGPSTTNLWYHSYANYMQLNRFPKEEFYDHFSSFFQRDQFRQHLAEIRWRNESCRMGGSDCISGFYFTTNFHTEEGSKGWVRISHLWRQISFNFAEFEPIVYGARQAFIADQLTSLPPSTLQTIGAGILSLMIMTAMFIHSLTGVLLVGSMLLSTDVGVVGLLTLWDTDLDPISMINILMSLDISIEYVTHICHHYFRVKGKDAATNLHDSLMAVGWPVIQGAIATVLGVLPLTFVDYYVSKTFFKTCFLVVATGIFHAFAILPILLLSIGRTAAPPKWNSH